MFENDENAAETKATGTDADGTSGSAPASQTESTFESTEAAIEHWFAKHFHGLGARLDEFLFNHIREAKEDLKSVLGRVKPQ